MSIEQKGVPVGGGSPDEATRRAVDGEGSAWERKKQLGNEMVKLGRELLAVLEEESGTSGEDSRRLRDLLERVEGMTSPRALVEMIENKNIFFSYSRVDEGMVTALRRRLESWGANPFQDTSGSRGISLGAEPKVVRSSPYGDIVRQGGLAFRRPPALGFEPKRTRGGNRGEAEIDKDAVKEEDEGISRGIPLGVAWKPAIENELAKGNHGIAVLSKRGLEKFDQVAAELEGMRKRGDVILPVWVGESREVRSKLEEWKRTGGEDERAAAAFLLGLNATLAKPGDFSDDGGKLDALGEKILVTLSDLERRKKEEEAASRKPGLGG
ncbi:hypothetical protein L0Y40_00210 [Candidatus Wolfebacteria bacterium]|nr:hypothetical protein [Candidatus Wolfebacteria bacterium]